MNRKSPSLPTKMPVPSVTFPLAREHVKETRERLLAAQKETVAAQTALEEELRTIRVLLSAVASVCTHSGTGSYCVDCGAHMQRS